MLFLIYGRLDGRAMRVRKPIFFSARCQDVYSSLRKVHEHSIANCLSIIYSALVVRVVQRATMVEMQDHNEIEGHGTMEDDLKRTAVDIQEDENVGGSYVG